MIRDVGLLWFEGCVNHPAARQFLEEVIAEIATGTRSRISGARECDMAFNEDIIERATKNTYFREVLSTGPHSQIVVMSIPAGGEIGEETHDDVDQVLIFTAGEGEAILNGDRSGVTAGRLVHVPAGTRHNFVNVGPDDLQLYTIYAPPEHAPGTVHQTHADAQAAEAMHKT